MRAMLDRLLGLSVHLDRFYVLATRDRRLNRLAEQYRGLTLSTLFEALVNGITCQQLS